MGVAKQAFEGITTNVPGVYTKSIFPPQPGASGAALDVVAVIGSGLGGIPYNASGVADEDRVNVITSVAQALDIIRGGNAFYMTEFFLSPAKDDSLQPPTQCLFFRVDPATQADAVLQDSGSNDIIDLVSTRYGKLPNQLARKVEAGTNIGHKVTVKFQGVKLVEKDDIGFEYLAIQYTGAGTACDMNITASQLDTTCAGAAADDLTLLFADFPTLGELVEYINEQANYTCRLLSASNADTTTFDAVTTQDIKTAEYTAVALVEALIQFFNNETEGEIEASLSSGATRTDVDNDGSFVFFANGANGTPTSTDWANCLALMEKFRINHILVATGDAATHAMVDTHVRDMSGIKQKRNRAASSGAYLSKTLAEKIDEAKVINSARFEYHFTAFSRADNVNNGALTEFDPFYGAALTAGIRFGNAVTISATFKKLNVLALSENYDIPTKESIIDAGGTLFHSEERGFVVTHNVTTYQGQNLILNLPSMLRTADAITLDSQARIQTRIASLNEAPTALVIEDMKNFLATNLLPDYRDEKRWLTDDVINDEPAFSDIEFALSGDRFDFEFTGIIPAPMHFVFVKQKFVVPGFAR